jgi:creatinine amidohydrolase
VLPPVAFSVAEFGADFAGTLSISPETSVALLKDICAAAGKRFRAVAFVNIHLEPAHVECVRKAAEEAKKAGVNVCYADITKKRWVETLGEAFKEGDHAGAFETSLMMAAAPALVRDHERISLPPIEGGLVAAIKKGAKTFVEAGGEDAYFGDPTAASAEEGEALFEALAEILSLSVREALGSKA